MQDLLKIHDTCLSHEITILEDVDMLEYKRLKAYESKDKERFKEILAVLNTVDLDVEAYRQYILSGLK